MELDIKMAFKGEDKRPVQKKKRKKEKIKKVACENLVLWIRNNYGTTIVRTDKITQVKGRKKQTKKDSLLSVFSIWDKGIMLKT